MVKKLLNFFSGCFFFFWEQEINFSSIFKMFLPSSERKGPLGMSISKEYQIWPIWVSQKACWEKQLFSWWQSCPAFFKKFYDPRISCCFFSSTWCSCSLMKTLFMRRNTPNPWFWPLKKKLQEAWIFLKKKKLTWRNKSLCRKFGFWNWKRNKFSPKMLILKVFDFSISNWEKLFLNLEIINLIIWTPTRYSRK